MKKIYSSGNLYISKSTIPNSGRGVFAANDIKKGDIIEICPVIEVPKYDAANVNESILTTYFFSFGRKKELMVVALGFGSIYNHTYTPNATYKKRSTETTIEFSALKNIKKDEEITVNYNSGDPKNKTPLWFNMPS